MVNQLIFKKNCAKLRCEDGRDKRQLTHLAKGGALTASSRPPRRLNFLQPCLLLVETLATPLQPRLL